MDELTGLCLRLLGDEDAAAAAAAQAGGADTRAAQLRAALAACRDARAGSEAAVVPPAEPEEDGLAAAVSRELAAATGRLPQRQQEALALRELLGLSHDLIAEVLEIEPAAVAALLARARVRLRTELRGGPLPPSDCPERDRTLRTATLRQDGEPVSQADEDWLIEHLGHCDGCRRAHSTMLEAAFNYRAWRLRPGAPT